MKYLLSLLFVLSVGISNVSSQIPKDLEAIKKSYTTFKNAILTKDGKTALESVDKSTIAYFKTILNHTLYSDSVVLDTINVFDRLQILNLRQRVNSKTLLSIDEYQLFKIYIDSGYASDVIVKDLELGKIDLKYKEGTARANVLKDEKIVPLIYPFIKENGNWKVILSNIYNTARRGLKQHLSQITYTDKEYIEMQIILESGKNLDPDIMLPVKK